MCTTAVLGHKSRQDTSNNWFCIGHVPNTKDFMKKLKNKNIHLRQQIFHDCLRTILGPLAQVQRDKPIVPLHLGNTIKYVSLHLPIAFLIGDGLKSDQLSGCLQSYTETHRLSRYCFCNWNNTDNPIHICNPIVQCHIDCLSMANLGVEHASPNVLHNYQFFIDNLPKKRFSMWQHTKEEQQQPEISYPRALDPILCTTVCLT